MQFYVISDNVDTQMGMRLAGMEGIVVHEADEVKKALDEAMANKDIAIILITHKLVELCEDKIYDLKLNCKYPLVVEIPDRHATSHITTVISKYVQDAIGIKI